MISQWSFSKSYAIIITFISRINRAHVAFRFTKTVSPQTDKKISFAKYVIRVTIFRSVHLEFFLVIFPWCIPLIKFFLVKLPLGVYPSSKIVGITLRVLLGATLYIATMYLSGTKEPSPWLETLSVKFLEFKVPKFQNALPNLIQNFLQTLF